MINIILGYNLCAIIPGYWYDQNHFPCTLCILHSVKIKQKKSLLKEHRKCALDSNVFCYICVHSTTPKERQKITDFIQKAYHAYFGVKIGDHEKPWAPYRVYESCMSTWVYGHLAFGVPIVWSRKIILMIATSAVSTFQDWPQRLQFPYNTWMCHLLYSPSLILMSYLFQYLRPSRFLTAKVISFQQRIIRTSMKNLMLQENLADFPHCSHMLIWMTWWGILIYRKTQLNYLLTDWKLETC